MTKNSFTKQERIVSKKQIEQLFGSRHASAVAYPLRVVYMTEASADDNPLVQVLVSVSKRHFKHAVDRNRTKRQIREAYRLSKSVVYDALMSETCKSRKMSMAFIWLADELADSGIVEQSVRRLLMKVADNMYCNEKGTDVSE
ncbi:MAG: ribonuclease P protein component [Prevotella sp.]|nr:ribonuclease P protein component [Prevotella sp.]